jgi:surfactin synthase thioesterase subunit
VCYPGREDRISDPLAERMEDLAGPLAAACAQLPAAPMAFFGHSMGASVAYETALRLDELRELVLPAVRADYQFVDQYDGRASTAVVSAPLTAYYG